MLAEAAGASIVLNQAAPGTDIIGTVGGTEYFRISITPVTGVVTFNQSVSVWHSDSTSDDDTSTLTLANAARWSGGTVTDTGDSELAALDLGVVAADRHRSCGEGAYRSRTVDEDGVVEGVANAGPGDGIAGGIGDVAGEATDDDRLGDAGDCSSPARTSR